MNRRNQARALSLACLLLSSTAYAAPSTHSTEITLIADVWPPYNITPDAKQPGYVVELATQIFAEHGYTVRYKVANSWDRAILDTRQGRHTAVIGASKQEAPDFVFPSEAVGVAVNAFFVKKGGAWQDWSFRSPDSLNGMRVGLIRGYYYGDSLERFFTQPEALPRYLQGDNALKRNIQKLLLNRLDVLIDDVNATRYYAHQTHSIEQLHAAPNRAASEQHVLHIAFSPKHPEAERYAAWLSEGIRRLRHTGALQRLLDRYELKDWQPRLTQDRLTISSHTPPQD